MMCGFIPVFLQRMHDFPSNLNKPHLRIHYALADGAAAREILPLETS
jgi:hypothetical protein